MTKRFLVSRGRDAPGTSTYGTVGDGYDGMCPSCADKAEEITPTMNKVDLLDCANNYHSYENGGDTCAVCGHVDPSEKETT